ncbi:MAG: RHS repeat domain-containing protein, partial [Flavobacteriales bacterium]
DVVTEQAYYPFGMMMPHPENVDAGGHRFGFNSKYSDDELHGNQNSYNFGARIYDARIGRWLSMDPKAGNYPDWSPYSYALDNPTNAIDPDGKDVYLVVWTTKNGEIGHAGIAVDNYEEVEKKVNRPPVEPALAVKGAGKEMSYTKTFYKKEGVTYYDLWPGESVGGKNAGKDVPAKYNKKNTNFKALKNKDITGQEGRPPDGVIRIKTDRIKDQDVKNAIQEFIKNNPKYNGRNCNCSDFAEEGVEAATGEDVNADEFIPFSFSTTPNKLFRKTSEKEGVKVEKEPSEKVQNSFIKGIQLMEAIQNAKSSKKSNKGED